MQREREWQKRTITHDYNVIAPIMQIRTASLQAAAGASASDGLDYFRDPILIAREVPRGKDNNNNRGGIR